MLSPFELFNDISFILCFFSSFGDYGSFFSSFSLKRGRSVSFGEWFSFSSLVADLFSLLLPNIGQMPICIFNILGINYISGKSMLSTNLLFCQINLPLISCFFFIEARFLIFFFPFLSSFNTLRAILDQTIFPQPLNHHKLHLSPQLI